MAGLVLAAGVAASLACAGGEVRMAGEDGTPHETHAANLRQAALHRTALGREWIEAADRALAHPTDVEPPHREVRFLEERHAVEDFTGDGDLLVRWVRMRAEGAPLRSHPDRTARPAPRLSGHAPVEVVGGAGRWFAVRLPDGREGYMAAGDVRRLSSLGELSLPAAAVVRRRPSPDALPIDSLAAGTRVARLGRYVLVRHAEDALGWIGMREG